VVIGGPATTIAGNLVFATVLNESPTSEWIGINVFNPVDGDPLVGNPAADFNFTVDGLTMTGQALFDNPKSGSWRPQFQNNLLIRQ
jgi:hypothetical protein